LNTHHLKKVYAGEACSALQSEKHEDIPFRRTNEDSSLWAPFEDPADMGIEELGFSRPQLAYF
jgi:hypothetical protein